MRVLRNLFSNFPPGYPPLTASRAGLPEGRPIAFSGLADSTPYSLPSCSLGPLPGPRRAVFARWGGSYPCSPFSIESKLRCGLLPVLHPPLFRRHLPPLLKSPRSTPFSSRQAWSATRAVRNPAALTRRVPPGRPVLTASLPKSSVRPSPFLAAPPMASNGCPSLAGIFPGFSADSAPERAA